MISHDQKRLPTAGISLLALPLLAGCLGEPEIEERWTLLEIVEASPTDAEAFAGAGPVVVTVRARITYREILTGFLVAEIRRSDVITASDTRFEHRDRHLDVARDVDLVLANSTSLGSDNVPVTGFDHLVQEVELSFEINSSQMTQRSQSPPASGLFLVVYFSDDIEEVEIAPGEEIEVIHPVLSTEMNILSTGLEIIPQVAAE